jgi:hypothetical protein
MHVNGLDPLATHDDFAAELVARAVERLITPEGKASVKSPGKRKSTRRRAVAVQGEST